MSLQLYLIDDHPLICAGLSAVLEQGGHCICGYAASVEAALADAAFCRCEVVLLDLSLGEGESSARIPALHGNGRRTLVYSMHEDAGRARRAFAAGAMGYVTKRETAECLLRAVSEVAAGRRYASPRIEAALVAAALADQSRLNWQGLTDREREVALLLGEGASADEIAERLSLSPRTVEAYYTRMNLKLSLPGVKELRRQAILAVREGQLVAAGR